MSSKISGNLLVMPIIVCSNVASSKRSSTKGSITGRLLERECIVNIYNMCSDKIIILYLIALLKIYIIRKSEMFE